MKNDLTKFGIEGVIGVKQHTQNQINYGLSKPRASTGTPINKLHGAAKQAARISNIGGGSKATGGKGLKGGINVLLNNAKADAVLKTVSKFNNYKRIK